MSEKFSHKVKCVCGNEVVLEFGRDETVQTVCRVCGRKITGYAIGDRMGTVVIKYKPER